MTAALPQNLDFTPVDCPRYNDYLAHELTQLAGHMNAGDYKFLKLAAIFDKRNAWVGAGIKSCAHWLQWQCGLTLGAARERVRVARCLEHLPLTNAAFAAGKISFSMVRAMSRAATDSNEDFYLRISEYGTASMIEQLVRTHRRVKKLQEKNPEKEQQESRSLTYFIDDDGMWVIKAKIPAIEGELVVKALNAIMDAEEEESAETVVAPEECEETLKPKATFPQKRVDALCTMAEHYVATAENGIGYLRGSERTQLILHVDINTLQKHSNTEPTCCHLDHDNWLHPDTARRLSCDASLVTVLEDDKGNVLNIGRRSRILPSAIKRALDIRDGGCRFPGCGCTRYVDAHHIKHWANGGETRLNNLITLCRFHHRQLHQGEFTITPDGNDFTFSNRRGIKILPTFRPQFPDQENVSAEILELEAIRPEISAETCKTKWAGESLDMDIAIGALLRRELVE